MASEKNIAFTIAVYTSDDWERNMGGWRCSALKIPGATIDAVFVGGQKVDDSKYQVVYNHSIIRWSDGTPPPQALISILLTQALLTQEQSNKISTELSQKWKKLAIILPFIAAILGSTITYISNKNKSATPPKETNTQQVQKNKVIVSDTFNLMFPRGLRAVITSTNLLADTLAKSNPEQYLVNKGIAIGKVDEGTKKAYAALVQKNPEEIEYVPWIVNGEPISIGYSHAIQNAGPAATAKYKEVELFQDNSNFKIMIFPIEDGKPQGPVVEPLKSGINWAELKSGLSQAFEELYQQKKYLQFGSLGVFTNSQGHWEYHLEYQLLDRR